VGQALLNEEVSDRVVNPLDASNPIIFSTGPLNGTLVPSASRLCISSLNLLTGGIAYSSVGGHFAAELRYAGVDHLVVRGAAEQPVILAVVDGQVRIVNARDLWGLSISDTQDTFRRMMGEPRLRMGVIGPAGESLCKAAAIVFDLYHVAGRCGLGAILGSKKVKAVAALGSGAIQVKHPDLLQDLVDTHLKKMDAQPSVKRRRALGTHGATERALLTATMPTRNFQDDQWDAEKYKLISAQTINSLYARRSTACFSCPVHCARYCEMRPAKYGREWAWSFHQNLAWDFGSKIDIYDLEALLVINGLCNDLGLDIDNASGALAWTIECLEKGFLTSKDVDGMDLRWGESLPVLKLLERLASRTGFGDVLANGTAEAARTLGGGSEYLAVHIAGQDLAEGIRAAKGWAFGVVTSLRGGGHLDGATMTEMLGVDPALSEETFGVPSAGEPRTYQGKEHVVVYFERLKEVVDSLGVCYFTSKWTDLALLGIDDYAYMLYAVTGRRLSSREFEIIADRSHSLQRCLNIIHGEWSPRKDMPPERLMREPIKKGPFAGELLDRNEWKSLLRRYYQCRGWDARSGKPTKKTLKGLDLNSQYRTLYGRGVR